MKLVKEHINEVLSFKRGDENSLSNLGVGKIKLIKDWLDKMEIENYIINDDLTIDVNDDVILNYKNLVKLPDYIKFNKVEGYFDCSYNKLVTLEGCPDYVNGYFDCEDNQLTSLEGCPKYVREEFYCYYNKKQFTEDEVTKLCNVKGQVYT